MPRQQRPWSNALWAVQGPPPGKKKKKKKRKKKSHLELQIKRSPLLSPHFVRRDLVEAVHHLRIRYLLAPHTDTHTPEGLGAQEVAICRHLTGPGKMDASLEEVY